MKKIQSSIRLILVLLDTLVHKCLKLPKQFTIVECKLQNVFWNCRCKDVLTIFNFLLGFRLHPRSYSIYPWVTFVA